MVEISVVQVVPEFWLRLIVTVTVPRFGEIAPAMVNEAPTVIEFGAKGREIVVFGTDVTPMVAALSAMNECGLLGQDIPVCVESTEDQPELALAVTISELPIFAEHPPGRDDWERLPGTRVNANAIRVNVADTVTAVFGIVD